MKEPRIKINVLVPPTSEDLDFAVQAATGKIDDLTEEEKKAVRFVLNCMAPSVIPKFATDPAEPSS